MKYLIYLWTIVSLTVLMSNADGNSLAPLKFKHITNKTGLSQSEVYTILQDKKGFMWFGTLDGLNKYNGYSIKTYNANFKKDHSLSHNSVTCLRDDSLGRIWIGTLGGGLNVFIPWKETFYQITDSQSNLSDNMIISLFINNDTLWIGTVTGINWMPLPKSPITSPVIDSQKQFVHQLTKSFNDPNIASRRINCIEKVQDNRLWLATYNGIIPIDTKTNSVIPQKSSNIYQIEHPVETMWKDHHGQVWLGTRQKGLFRVTFNNNQIATIDSFQIPGKNRAPTIMSLMQDKQNNLWIATRGSGIKIIPKQQLQKEQITVTTVSKNNTQNSAEKLNSNFIKTLYASKNGIIWVGTLGKGVNYFNPHQKRFYNYKIPDKPSTNNFIRAICHDSYGNIWLGTLGKGLHVIDEKTGAHVKTLFENESIFAIHKIANGNLFVGAGAQLHHLKYADTNEIYHHKTITNISSAIHSIVKSKNRSYWLGTQAGIYKIEFSKNHEPVQISHYQKDAESPISLTHNNVRVLAYDATRNCIWAGTEGGGLNCLVLDQNHMPVNVFHFTYTENKNSISSNFVRDIHIDSQDHIWVGTYQGLNKITIQNNNHYRFQIFNTDNGFPNNLIQSITEDKHNNLWIGTNRGLVRFSKNSHNIRTYRIADGIQSYEFSEHTKYKNENGKIFLGGINGVTAFYPDSIYKNTIQPELVITEFNIENKTADLNDTINGRVILDKSIVYTDSIMLRYNENNFSFKFSGLQYLNPHDHQYAYKLEGYDKQWIYVSAQNRLAKYTNLNPGTYTFKVKASNNDGIWNTNPETIFIKITPPFWATTWAYILYIMVAGLAAYFSIQYLAKRANRRRQEALNEKHRRKMAEVNKLKLRFFTNISHELRTPLTLILGPLETLLSSTKHNSGEFKQLQTIKKNADRLYRLIDQLLEMRKVETGNSKLSAEQKDIITFTQEISKEFNPLADKRNIALSFHTELHALHLWFDTDKMEKVLFNIISNALKNTQPGGEITIRIKKQKRVLQQYKEKILKKIHTHSDNAYAVIQITDTGKGMSQEKLKKLFERFYYTSEEDHEMKGHSIGLSLTKDLVELHHGVFTINSKPEKGTIISIYLPLGKEHLSSEEMKQGTLSPNLTHFREAIHNLSEEFDSGEFAPSESESDETDNTPEEHTAAEPLSESEKNGYQAILIIEDNYEMREFLQSNLTKQYHVYTAANGEEGINTAASVIPDLIISDIRMPKINGFEVCKQIKNNINTSHIPIILLTVKNEQESQYEGIKIGADDYITKPFDMQYLHLKIENLIQSREKLKKQFANNLDLKPQDISVTSVDEQFIEKIKALMEQHMDNPDFNVDNLIQELGMSRTNLYRKMKNLLGMSGKEFINSMRLKRAAQLLKQNKLNISEVAYAVGHSNPRYFAKWFKDNYGLSPSEFANQNGNENETSE